MGKKVDLTQKSDLKAAGKAKEKKVQPAEESSESEGETAPPLKKGKKPALGQSEPLQEVATKKEKKPKKAAAEVVEQKSDKGKKAKAQEEKKAEEPKPVKAAKKQSAKMPTAKVDSSSEEDDQPVAAKRPSTSASEAPKKKSKGEQGKPIAAAADSTEPADPMEIYVGGLPYTATEEEVKVFFSDYGTVENVKFLRKHNGMFRGAGFVKFSSREEAEKATKLNGTEHMGRTLKVNFSANKPSGSRPEGGINTICVRNLSYESTDDSVASFFSQCGTVVQVRVARNQEGKGKGFAHVEFENVEGADKAVKLSGQKVDDRPIRVDYAHPKRNTEENKEKTEEEKPKAEKKGEKKPKGEEKKPKGEEKKPKGEEKKPKGEEKKPKGEEKKPKAEDAPLKKEAKSKKTKL